MTMTSRPDAIPLPEHLTDGSCGCGGTFGQHKTTCAPAIAYDAMDLREHPDYAVGQAFAAIRWEYPLSLSLDVHVRVDVDPAAFVADHQQDYDGFELDDEYEPWEKPLVFILSCIEEDIDVGGCFHKGRVCYVDDSIDYGRERPTWTPETYAAMFPQPADEPEHHPQTGPGLFDEGAPA